MTEIADAVRLTETDHQRVSDLCRGCSAFFELVEGQPATAATAAEILGPLESRYADGTKHVWGFEKEGRLTALAEILEGYPSMREWYIGLLLIAPEERGKGMGTQLCACILEWMRAEGATTVRLVVQRQNSAARTFWERQGFVVEREVVKRTGRLEGPVWILARTVEEVD